MNTELGLWMWAERKYSKGASSHRLLEHFQRKGDELGDRTDVRSCRHLTGKREQAEKGKTDDSITLIGPQLFPAFTILNLTKASYGSDREWITH
jgi:hypothetical protein